MSGNPIVDIELQIADLERKKQELIEAQKQEVLSEIDTLIRKLADMGFSYRISNGGGSTGGGPGRRSGIRDDVLNTVKNGNGMRPADIADALGLDDKSGKQSVANALSALKKTGKVTATDGKYTAS